jgi:hypothetical protein
MPHYILDDLSDPERDPWASDEHLAPPSMSLSLPPPPTSSLNPLVPAQTDVETLKTTQKALEAAIERIDQLERRIAQLESERATTKTPAIHRKNILSLQHTRTAAASLTRRIFTRLIAQAQRIIYRSLWDLLWLFYVSKLRDLLIWGILRFFWTWSRWKRHNALRLERVYGYTRDLLR